MIVIYFLHPMDGGMGGWMVKVSRHFKHASSSYITSDGV